MEPVALLRNPRAALAQDEWWCNRYRLFVLIDLMDERYRRNCANWMLDRAATIAIYLWRTEEIWSPFLGGPYPGDDDVPEFVRETKDQIRNRMRRRMDRGEHLDLVCSSPLYRKLAA